MATKSQHSVVIPINLALSSALDISSEEIVAIQMPASWTTAGLSFQGSSDGVTYGTDIVDNAGTAATVSAAASAYIALSVTQRDLLNAAKFLIVRSGTSGTPVNQAAARTVILVGVNRT